MHTTSAIKQLGLTVVPLFLSLGLGKPAHAATIFFGQDQNTSTHAAKEAEVQFLSKLKQVQTENFESFAPSTNSPLTLTFGQDTATLIGGGAIRGSAFNGLHAISGKNYWSLTYAEQVKDTYTIAFSTAQAIFGFYATDMGDAGVNTFSLLFNHASGSPSVVQIGHALPSAEGNKLFFGYIDPENPFTSVTFLANGPIERDGFGLDDITIGRLDQVAAVPEPEVWPGLLLFTGLLGWVRRSLK